MQGTSTPSNAGDTRTEVYVDAGPVSAAVAVLFAQSTLGDHIRIEQDTSTTVRVFHTPDDVPYEMWGSGTQGLWRLLCSMARSADSVSLYEVVSRLDSRNRRAVAAAVTELCS